MTKISTEYAAYSIVQQSNDQDIYIVRCLQYFQQNNDQDIFIVRSLQFCSVKSRPKYVHSIMPTVLCRKVMTNISTYYAAYNIVQQSNDQDIYIVRCLQYCKASNDQDIYIVCCL